MGTRRGRSPPTANQTTTYDKETRRPKYKNKKYDDRKTNNKNQDWIKTATCHGCGHLLRDCRSSKQNNKKTFQAENKKAFQAKTKTENDKEEYYLSFYAVTSEEQKKETPQKEEEKEEEKNSDSSERETSPERQLGDFSASRGSQPDCTSHLGDFRKREGELLACTGEDSQGNQRSQHWQQTHPAAPEQGIDSGLVCTYSRLTTDDSQGNQYFQHRLQTQPATPEQGDGSLASDSDSQSIELSSSQCRLKKDNIRPSDQPGYARRMKDDKQPLRHSSQLQKFCSSHSSREERQLEQKHRNEGDSGDLEQKKPDSSCT
jgi:hypothetical protein